MITKTTNLTQKEAEAIMWVASEFVDLAAKLVTDPRSPISVMRAEGFDNDVIRNVGEELEVIAADRILPGYFLPSTKLAMRLVVENTTWIECYRTSDRTKDSQAHIDEALATLRSLAAKLEERGIEITYIPYE